MITFLRENILFVLGVALLSALIAGASALQTGHDTDTVRSPERGVSAANSTTTPWKTPTIINNAMPVGAQSTAITSTHSATTSAPPVRHRVYNRGQDDD